MYFLQAFKPLALDLLATILFVMLYWLSGSIILATAIAVAAGVVRFAYMKYREQPIGPLQYVSIALVVVSGVTTLLTRDPLFVQMKSSIVMCAVGIVMLRTNWLAPYLPEIAKDNLDPSIVRWAGHGWGALQIVLAIANALTVMALSFDGWAWYASTVPASAHVIAFLLQYAIFRRVIRRNIRTRIAAQTAT